MGQVANLKNAELPSFLPRIRVNTGAMDHQPVEAMQLRRFDGVRCASFGEVPGN
jgi:hypothetical protein